MPHVIETTVWNYEELSEEAKEKARNKWRENGLDYEWWDSVFETVAEAAEMLGIDLRHRTARSATGREWKEPSIYFSGFCSQGDGACFEGNWHYRKGSVRAIRAEFPKDKALHAVALALSKCAGATFYTASAGIVHRGHYYHPGCMDITVWHEQGRDVRDDLSDALRDFANWIYAMLEREYEYLTSDECVAEMLIANEYAFNEDGSMA